MKQKIVLFSLLTLVLIGCKNNYTLEGSMEKSLLEFIPAGTELGIYNRVNKEWVKIDSTLMKDDGTFVFKGRVEEPSIAYINASDDNLLQFVLEPGHIKATIDEEGIVRLDGTENNRLLSDFNYGIYEAETEAEALDFMRTFIADNINTIVGYNMLSDYLLFFDIDQIDAMISNMTDETKAQPVVEKIIEKADVLRQSAVGKQYLDVALKTPADETLSLSDLVGKTDFLLVDFWASWCGPCRRAMPQMVELYDRFRADNKLEILGISLDDNKEAWLGAIDKLGLKWQHISDLQGWQSEGAQLYGITSIPATLLINKEGIIVARNLEPEQYAELIAAQNE